TREAAGGLAEQECRRKQEPGASHLRQRTSSGERYPRKPIGRETPGSRRTWGAQPDSGQGASSMVATKLRRGSPHDRPWLLCRGRGYGRGMDERLPAILLGLTGLRIDGGIASVSRTIAAALDERVEAGVLSRVDRVLLLEDPVRAALPP